MQAARLNVDTFAIVCEFLTDIPDVLRCVLICSTLRSIATQCLLSMRPVRLRGGTSIPQFHHFLFANAPARAPYVRALDIDFPPNPDHIPLLFEILTTCPQIQCVSVFSSHVGASMNVFGVMTGDLHSYMSNMHVFRAIMAVKSLHSLSLYLTPPNLYGTDVLKSILSHLDVPLRTFRAGQFLGHWNPDTLEHLSCLAPTLEELELGYLVLGAATSFNAPPWPPISTLTPFPAVRSLTISTSSALPQVEHLQHLFPALDGVLSFGRPSFFQELHGDVTNIRAVNQRAQEPEAGGVGSRAGVWRKLDRVECDALTFYTLGLRCPIRLAVISNVEPHTLHHTAEALRENPVSRLKLELKLEPDSGLGMFAQLFAQESAENVTHLTFFLNYGSVQIGGREGSFGAREFQWDEIRAQWGNLLVSKLFSVLRTLIPTSRQLCNNSSPCTYRLS